MEQHAVERKLAAILAADIVGYSRLMGADEVGTLVALKALHRDIIEPAVGHHNGRVFKLMGDGLLASFASAVEAVVCAAAIQQGFARRNDNLPAGRHILLRCGINLGDVVVDGSDLYGDGVNVAARLEHLCEPGGICISRAVRDQVRDKLRMPFEDGGEQLLKNIARPVRVFQLPPTDIAELRLETPPRITGKSPVAGAIAFLADAASSTLQHMTGSPAGLLHRSEARVSEAPTPLASGKASNVSPAHLSIVVLPFASIGGDPAPAFYADALTADITTDLSRIPGSFVIAAGTAFTYKDKRVDPKRIRQDLDVR
jgi:adenylate cyclase